MENKKSKAIKTVATALAGTLVAGVVLCSCAPFYGRVGEMIESVADVGREKIEEAREEYAVGG